MINLFKTFLTQKYVILLFQIPVNEEGEPIGDAIVEYEKVSASNSSNVLTLS